jgi:hypothetical protein
MGGTDVALIFEVMKLTTEPKVVEEEDTLEENVSDTRDNAKEDDKQPSPVILTLGNPLLNQVNSMF